MVELEKTYLAKEIPADLTGSKCVEIIDVYIPESQTHPKLRLRKTGDKFELTKKEPIDGKDVSRQLEQTIVLSKNEFDYLNEHIVGKRIRKTRHYYDYKGQTAEIDVFQDALEGLVLVDFEFTSVSQKNSFQTPNFCLADVTSKDFIAGGMICGKTYTDIKFHLDKFGYKKLSFNLQT